MSKRINDKAVVMIKIILAEDHNIVRDGIRKLLDSEPNFEIVAESTNGAEVLHILREGVEADIVLADMNMPVMGGIELAEKLKETGSKVKFIMLTMIDHEN